MTYAYFGAAAVGSVVMAASLLQGLSLYSDRVALAERNGSREGDLVWKCGNECGRMESLASRHEFAGLLFSAGAGVAGVSLIGGVTFLILKLTRNERGNAAATTTTRVVPAVGQQSGGLRLEGTF
jgi:hypothetical protein